MSFLMNDYSDVRFFKGKRLFKKPKALMKQIKKQFGGALKIGAGAGLGFLTGGPAGAVMGAAGGMRAARQGNWRGVGQGVGMGLGAGAGMSALGFGGGGLGGSLYQGAAGLLGGGGAGGGGLSRTIGPDGVVQYATGGGGGGGAGGGGWMSTFGKGLDLTTKLFGGYQSASQLKQANKLQRLQMNILQGLGEVDPEEYGQAERQYSTSMFRRGLGGSSLYGQGLAQIYPAMQSQAKKERLYALTAMNQ